ncbi:multidrug ABC transporter ATP-binding protein [Escherichia coli]|uniref:Multidrug ABC transporter ATP-binding protein n=1 Tax=Escherichia coli TaxID=562 RepID=A0A376YDL5_ECOLX|nr:multidrug ABC transporter ATP-binding protein [Escherichia coli]
MSSIKFAKSQRAAPGRGNGAARSGGAGGYLPRQRDAGADISEERVWQALETVQLAELARSMSDGIYTPLASRGIISQLGKSNCWHWRACWSRRRKS